MKNLCCENYICNPKYNHSTCKSCGAVSLDSSKSDWGAYANHTFKSYIEASKALTAIGIKNINFH